MHSTTTKSQQSGGVIGHYREFLPISAATPIISLGEGDTPLIYSPRLSERVGRACEVFVKNEGVNPTGSFKDRGMTVAVSKAVERGTTALICASTGNTSASAAAYAARAGISCVVILPAGKIATGKLLQAFAYGARIVAIDGNFDDALRIVRELGATGEFTIVNSINPDRIAGQKTAAFEIIDELGDAPDFHLLPVGNAGNITAYWAGYQIPRVRKINKIAGDDWLPGGRRGADVLRLHNRQSGNGRLGDSNRKSCQLAPGVGGHRRVARRDRCSHR